MWSNLIRAAAPDPVPVDDGWDDNDDDDAYEDDDDDLVVDDANDNNYDPGREGGGGREEEFHNVSLHEHEQQQQKDDGDSYPQQQLRQQQDVLPGAMFFGGISRLIETVTQPQFDDNEYDDDGEEIADGWDEDDVVDEEEEEEEVNFEATAAATTFEATNASTAPVVSSEEGSPPPMVDEEKQVDVSDGGWENDDEDYGDLDVAPDTTTTTNATTAAAPEMAASTPPEAAMSDSGGPFVAASATLREARTPPPPTSRTPSTDPPIVTLPIAAPLMATTATPAVTTPPTESPRVEDSPVPLTVSAEGQGNISAGRGWGDSEDFDDLDATPVRTTSTISFSKAAPAPPPSAAAETSPFLPLSPPRPFMLSNMPESSPPAPTPPGASEDTTSAPSADAVASGALATAATTIASSDGGGWEDDDLGDLDDDGDNPDDPHASLAATPRRVGGWTPAVQPPVVVDGGHDLAQQPQQQRQQRQVETPHADALVPDSEPQTNEDGWEDLVVEEQQEQQTPEQETEQQEEQLPSAVDTETPSRPRKRESMVDRTPSTDKGPNGLMQQPGIDGNRDEDDPSLAVLVAGEDDLTRDTGNAAMSDDEVYQDEGDEFQYGPVVDHTPTRSSVSPKKVTRGSSVAAQAPADMLQEELEEDEDMDATDGDDEGDDDDTEGAAAALAEVPAGAAPETVAIQDTVVDHTPGADEDRSKRRERRLLSSDPSVDVVYPSSDGASVEDDRDLNDAQSEFGPVVDHLPVLLPVVASTTGTTCSTTAHSVTNSLAVLATTLEEDYEEDDDMDATYYAESTVGGGGTTLAEEDDEDDDDDDDEDANDDADADEEDNGGDGWGQDDDVDDALLQEESKTGADTKAAQIVVEKPPEKKQKQRQQQRRVVVDHTPCEIPNTPLQQRNRNSHAGDRSLDVLATLEDMTRDSGELPDNNDVDVYEDENEEAFGPVVDQTPRTPKQPPLCSSALSTTNSLAVQLEALEEDYERDDAMDDTCFGDSTIAGGTTLGGDAGDGWDHDDDDVVIPEDVEVGKTSATSGTAKGAGDDGSGAPTSGNVALVDHTPSEILGSNSMPPLNHLVDPSVDVLTSGSDSDTDHHDGDENEDAYGPVVDHTPRTPKTPASSSAAVASVMSTTNSLAVQLEALDEDYEGDDAMDDTYFGDSTIAGGTLDGMNNNDGWGDHDEDALLAEQDKQPAKSSSSKEVITSSSIPLPDDIPMLQPMEEMDDSDHHVHVPRVMVDHTPSEMGSYAGNHHQVRSSTDRSVDVLTSESNTKDGIILAGDEENDSCTEGGNTGQLYGPVVDHTPTTPAGATTATVRSDSVVVQIHDLDTVDETFQGASTMDDDDDDDDDDDEGNGNGNDIGDNDAVDIHEGVGSDDATEITGGDSARELAAVQVGGRRLSSRSSSAHHRPNQLVDHIPQRPESRFGDASTLVAADASEMLSQVMDDMAQEDNFGPVVDVTPHPPREGPDNELLNPSGAASTAVFASASVAADDLDDADETAHDGEDHSSNAWPPNAEEAATAPNPQSGNDDPPVVNRVNEQVVDFLPPADHGQNEGAPSEVEREASSEVAVGGALSLMQPEDPKEDDFGPVVDQTPTPVSSVRRHRSSSGMSSTSTAASQVSASECRALEKEDRSAGDLDSSNNNDKSNVVVDNLPHLRGVHSSTVVDSTVTLAQSQLTEDEEEDEDNTKFGPIVDHLPTPRIAPSRGGSTVDALATVSEVDSDEDHAGGWGDSVLEEALLDFAADTSVGGDSSNRQATAGGAGGGASGGGVRPAGAPGAPAAAFRKSPSASDHDRSMSVRFESSVKSEAAAQESSPDTPPRRTTGSASSTIYMDNMDGAPQFFDATESAPPPAPVVLPPAAAAAASADGWDEDDPVLDEDDDGQPHDSKLSADGALLSKSFAEADTPPSTPYSKKEPNQMVHGAAVLLGETIPEMDGESSRPPVLDCETCANASTTECPCIQKVLAVNDTSSAMVGQMATPEGDVITIDFSKLLQEEVAKRQLIEEESKALKESRQLEESLSAAKVSEMQSEISDVRAFSRTQSQAVEALQAERANLRNDKQKLIQDAERLNLSLTESKATWSQRESTLETEIRTLKQELEASAAKLTAAGEDSKRRVGSVQAELDAKTSRCNDLTEQLSRLENGLQGSETVKTNLTSEIEKLSRQLEQDAAGFRAKLDESQRLLAEARRTADATRKESTDKLEKTNAEIRTLRSANDLLTRQVTDLDAQHKKSLQEQQRLLAEKTESHMTLESSLRTVENDKADLQRELSQQQTSMARQSESLSNELKVALEERDALRKSLSESKDSIASLQKHIDEHGLERDALESKRDAEIQKLNADLKQVRTALAVAEDEKKSTSCQLETITADKDDLARQLREAQTKCQSAQSAAAHSELVAAKEEAKSVKSREEITSLRSELSRVTEHLKIAEAERQRMGNSESSLEAELKKAEDQLTALQVESRHLASSLESVTEEKKSLASKVQESHATFRSLELVAENAKRLAADGDARLSQSRQEIGSLRGQVSQLSQQLTAAQQEQQNAIAMGNASLRTDLSNAQNALAASEGQLQELKANMHVASTERASLIRQLEEAQTHCRSLESAIQDSKLQITKEEGRLAKAKQEIDVLRGELSKVGDAKNRAETERQQLAAKVTDLERRSQRAEYDTRALSERANELQSLLSARQDELTSMTSQRDQLVVERDELAAKYREVETESSATRTQMQQRMKSDVRIHNTQIADLNRELSRLQKQLEESATLSDSLEKERTRLKDAANERDALVEENEEMLVQFGLLKEQMDASEEEIRGLQSELEAVRRGEGVGIHVSSNQNGERPSWEYNNLRQEHAGLEADYAKLQSANEALEAAVKSAADEKEKLQSLVASLESRAANDSASLLEKEKLESRVEELKSRSAALDSQSQSQQREISALKQQLTHRSDDSAGLREHVKELQLQCAKKDEALAAKEAERRAAVREDASSSQTEGEVSALRRRLNKLQVSATEKDDRVRDLEEKLEEMRAELGSTRQRLENTEASLKAKEELASFEAAICDLREDEGRISDVVASYDKRMKDLEAELSERDCLVAKLSKSVNELQFQLETCHTSVTSFDLGAIIEEVNPGTEKQQQASPLLSPLAKKDVQSLENELAATRSSLASKEEELETLNEKIKELESRPTTIPAGLAATASTTRSSGGAVYDARQQQAEDMETLRSHVVSLAAALERSESRRAEAIDRLLTERQASADSLRRLSESVKRFYSTVSFGDA